MGETKRGVRHCFTKRASLPKLEDLYVPVAWGSLSGQDNEFSIYNADSECAVLVHRVFIGAERPSMRRELPALPPLPSEPRLRIGFETDLLTP